MMVQAAFQLIRALSLFFMISSALLNATVFFLTKYSLSRGLQPFRSLLKTLAVINFATSAVVWATAPIYLLRRGVFYIVFLGPVSSYPRSVCLGFFFVWIFLFSFLIILVSIVFCLRFAVVNRWFEVTPALLFRVKCASLLFCAIISSFSCWITITAKAEYGSWNVVYENIVRDHLGNPTTKIAYFAYRVDGGRGIFLGLTGSVMFSGLAVFLVLRWIGKRLQKGHAPYAYQKTRQIWKVFNDIMKTLCFLVFIPNTVLSYSYCFSYELGTGGSAFPLLAAMLPCLIPIIVCLRISRFSRAVHRAFCTVNRPEPSFEMTTTG